MARSEAGPVEDERMVAATMDGEEDLPPRQRAVLIPRDVLGRPPRDAAEATLLRLAGGAVVEVADFHPRLFPASGLAREL